MTTSIFTPTSTTSHSQNPCPPATTQDQADPREPAPTNHCSQAEHARPLINFLPRPEKASEPELDDMSTTGRATSPPDQSLILGVIRVIEDQITTLRPYNARYTGDHRSIFRKRYAEMITRISLDLERFSP
jgi:hypothetical protein